MEPNNNTASKLFLQVLPLTHPTHQINRLRNSAGLFSCLLLLMMPKKEKGLGKKGWGAGELVTLKRGRIYFVHPTEHFFWPIHTSTPLY